MTDTTVNRRDIAAAFLVGSAGLALAARPAAAQGNETDLTSRIALLEDQAALKRLVDTFSSLADTKDIDAQVLLFTEDATVESWSDGQKGSTFTSRAELAKAFGGFLAQFSTVYHINGQQVVTVDGDQATGTSYCLVVLIREEDGKVIRRASGVRYADSYIRQDGQWLIAGRTSHFEWTDTTVTPA